MSWWSPRKRDAFAGKVALVTGAASGLGLALTEELCRRGASVVMADLNREALEAACAGMPGRVWPVVLDVADFTAVEAAMDQAVEHFGGLDLLFNNAGIAALGEIGELDMDHWRRVVDVNFLGVVHGCKAAFKVMAARGGGHIVNTASIGGIAGFPLLSSYAATKAAVIALSTSLRVEGRASGVKVSVLCPACFRSQIYEKSTGVPKPLPPSASAALGRVPMLDAAEAARMALAGVERNQAIIVFPRWAWCASTLWRASQVLARPFHYLALWRIRQVRAQDKAGP